MNSLQTSSYSTFESILTAPLAVNEKYLGSLTLLRKTQDGFDEEKRELIQTFARQASISIENFRLLSKTIEAERLKEEIKIAQRIQQSLLPKDLAVSERLQIEAFYRSAYEVGGDYYDIYKINPTEFLVIIGDVSGKGSTAAFHMAQMKGIFQSLAQLNFPPTQFLAYANQALAKCLEKTDFITVTLLHIDLEKNAVEIAQAGHCPVLVYQHRKRKVSYLISEGLGLGIVRNHSFEHYIHSRPFYFEVGDMILLYTDGIVEARDINNEEYGYERLKDFLLENIALSPSEIIKALIADLEDFGKNRPIHDDHTAVLIQFL
jgi:serine phosphatase RsbU (regulator of sigma subunit)